jgi:hypothetical protein
MERQGLANRVEAADLALEAVGGLISGGDIARWWGVSRSRVTELTAHPLFPRPVYASPRIKLYYADEVAAFRHRRRS